VRKERKWAKCQHLGIGKCKQIASMSCHAKMAYLHHSTLLSIPFKRKIKLCSINILIRKYTLSLHSIYFSEIYLNFYLSVKIVNIFGLYLYSIF